MQQPASNGVVENGASCSTNGHCGDANGVTLSNNAQDIVRIIGQYLSSEGLQ